MGLDLDGLPVCPRVPDISQNANADAMSQLPLPGLAKEPPIPAETVLLLDHLNASPVTAAQIRSWTTQDPLLARVLRLIQEGDGQVSARKSYSHSRPAIMNYPYRMGIFYGEIGWLCLVQEDNRYWKSFMPDILG